MNDWIDFERARMQAEAERRDMPHYANLRRGDLVPRRRWTLDSVNFWASTAFVGFAAGVFISLAVGLFFAPDAVARILGVM